ncbi:MAG: FlgD immunoglobulin-like domain containing protein [bacterium]
MSRLLRLGGASLAALLFANSLALAAEHHVTLAPGEEFRIDRGAFAYTLTPISPFTQFDTDIPDFISPYFKFLLTNDSATADDFYMEVSNVTQPTWFPQVCLREVCFPSSVTLPFAPGESDTVGVNVIATSDGIGEFDFYLESVGDPGLNDMFHLTLVAGTAAVDAPEFADAFVPLLRQNVPNPMSDATEIGFVLPQESRVDLRLYDVQGRLVETLASGVRTAGAHSVEWNARDAAGKALPNGVYFYRLETSTGVTSRTLTLIR